MRERGLEPPRPRTPEPKSGASANSATRATLIKLLMIAKVWQVSRFCQMSFHDFVPTLLVYWEKPEPGGGPCSIGSPYIEHGRVYDLLIGNDIDELMQDIQGSNVIGWRSHFFCKMPHERQISMLPA